MAWIILFLAGLLEIGWAVGLKYTDGFHPPASDGCSRWPAWSPASASWGSP